jgi:hypothetical protein
MNVAKLLNIKRAAGRNINSDFTQNAYRVFIHCAYRHGASAVGNKILRERLK